MNCPLCSDTKEDVLWHDAFCRVILVGDADYPGFCRVILNAHIREMTDLAPGDRLRLLNVVFQVEGALRAILNPDKINLASLGNLVPHLHWHVIPRFVGDRHFPDAIWATPKIPASMNGPVLSPTRASPEQLRVSVAGWLADRLGPPRE